MRIKYTGTAEAGVPRFPGLWQPGEERDVSDEDGRYLLGSSQFVDVSAASVAPQPTPEPAPVDAPALPPEAPASDIA
jgi:hypothetical protein